MPVDLSKVGVEYAALKKFNEIHPGSAPQPYHVDLRQRTSKQFEYGSLYEPLSLNSETCCGASCVFTVCAHFVSNC